MVVCFAKGLTSTGITLCATIHSPTPRTFALFDRYCNPIYSRHRMLMCSMPLLITMP